MLERNLLANINRGSVTGFPNNFRRMTMTKRQMKSIIILKNKYANTNCKWLQALCLVKINQMPLRSN